MQSAYLCATKIKRRTPKGTPKHKNNKAYGFTSRMMRFLSAVSTILDTLDSFCEAYSCTLFFKDGGTYATIRV